MYKMSEEEKKYLKYYDISHYDRPSVATDIVVFSIFPEEQNDIRKLPDRKLKVLLVKRASFPYKDCWALPGGFCRQNESVIETAKRELFEETNVKNAYLALSGIYGDVGRDPRGWIISHSFMALINGKEYVLRGGTDAWEAKWFDVDVTCNEVSRECINDAIKVVEEYVLNLTSEDIVLSATIKESKEFVNYHEEIKTIEVTGEDIAFDHGKIILHALLDLRKKVNEDSKIVFDLLPQYFTMTELQQAHEIILDKKLLVANFRRKIAEYVVETDKTITGSGYRPAKLFARSVEKFCITSI